MTTPTVYEIIKGVSLDLPPATLNTADNLGDHEPQLMDGTPRQSYLALCLRIAQLEDQNRKLTEEVQHLRYRYESTDHVFEEDSW